MMKQTALKATLALLAAASMNACGNDTSDTLRQDSGVDRPAGTGGKTGTGGMIGTGGVMGTGGSTSRTDPTTNGGATGSGGVIGAGGTTKKGGATGSGGVLGTGGVMGTGGVRDTGGAMGTGGVKGTGGKTGAGGSTSSTDPTSRCLAAGLKWKTANKTEYTSYPEPGSEECIKYSGCEYQGMFAGCSDTMSLEWVKSHNIVAAFPDFETLQHHDLCLKSGSKMMVVLVIDTCGDSDCDNCCTENKGSADQLIDIESFTAARFGVEDGPIQWADLGPTTGDDCPQ